MQVGLETRPFPYGVKKYTPTPTTVTVMLCSFNPFLHRDPRLWDDRAKVAQLEYPALPCLPGIEDSGGGQTRVG